MDLFKRMWKLAGRCRYPKAVLMDGIEGRMVATDGKILIAVNIEKDGETRRLGKDKVLVDVNFPNWKLLLPTKSMPRQAFLVKESIKLLKAELKREKDNAQAQYNQARNAGMRVYLTEFTKTLKVAVAGKSVNAKDLLLALECMGGKIAEVFTDENGPVFVENENGMAFISPFFKEHAEYDIQGLVMA